MRQYDDAVARLMQVCLERVGPRRHGAVEGGHGVLREGCLVAAVADVLGQPRPCGRPGPGSEARDGSFRLENGRQRHLQGFRPGRYGTAQICPG